MGKLIDLAGLTEFKTKLATIFAAKSHNHAAGDINSGELSVSRGGTGKNTHTSNAILTGNGTSAVKNVATASGAFFATAANGAASFATLPIAQGGTGKTNKDDARVALGAAAASHTHDDRYYTETEVDGLLDDKVDTSDFYATEMPISSSNSTKVSATIAAQQNGLAIIVDGDTCSTAVPAGDYAYIKNNTHGLTEGLYANTSSSAFPTSGGTANSMVFTAVPTGGLNSLNSKIAGKMASDRFLFIIESFNFSNVGSKSTGSHQDINYSVGNPNLKLVGITTDAGSGNCILVPFYYSNGGISRWAFRCFNCDSDTKNYSGTAYCIFVKT